MPIKISKSLIKKLPEDEQEGIEAYLAQKAAGRCFLCGGGISEAADILVPDHDTPEAEGGPTTRLNLNLVHRSCNAAKRNSPSIDVRPVLKLQRFIRDNGGLVRYGEVLPHFSVTPKPTQIEDQGDRVTFGFSDGTTTTVPVISESTAARTYRVAFVSVPAVALFNDDACQPRNLKISQVTAIYNDLRNNPLHEAPGCRLGEPTGNALFRILMFDGQHKSVSMWLSQQSHITVKVYLDISKDEAIVLVNSVQAKIKKLPLSPFELAAKMSDEWETKLAEYEHAVGSAEASEAGFIEWLPTADRTRAKQALASALIQDILDDNQLLFGPLLRRGVGGAAAIPEAAFKNKVLGVLLEPKPLEEQGDEMNRLRARERANVVRTLNILAQTVFISEGDPSPQFETRAKRMSYQSSLRVVADLIKAVVGRIMAVQAPNEMLKSEPTEADWAKIEAAIVQIADHPVWKEDLTRSAKLRAVNDALSKNQNASKAFEKVRLDLGYAVGVRPYDPEDITDT